jgi:hypothetical protein
VGDWILRINDRLFQSNDLGRFRIDCCREYWSTRYSCTITVNLPSRAPRRLEETVEGGDIELLRCLAWLHATISIVGELINAPVFVVTATIASSMATSKAKASSTRQVSVRASESG